MSTTLESTAPKSGSIDAVLVQSQLHQAELRVRMAEERVRATEREYLAANSGQIKHEIKAAYDAFTAARREAAEAGEELRQLQAEAGMPVELHPIDLVELAKRAVRGIRLSDEAAKQKAQRALEGLRSSLAIRRELEALGQRVISFGSLYRYTLRDDRGFFLFCDACEKFGRAVVEDSEKRKGAAGYFQVAEALREKRLHADSPELTEQAREELAGHTLRYEQAVRAEALKVLCAEMPEAARLFSGDGISYLSRKAAGRRALIEGVKGR